LLHHVGRAPPTWESDNEIRLSFLEHLTVSNWPGRAAVPFPICRKRPNGNASMLVELAASVSAH
jgi:hypothetical protein